MTIGYLVKGLGSKPKVRRLYFSLVEPVIYFGTPVDLAVKQVEHIMLEIFRA
jgi:hypothetical protein